MSNQNRRLSPRPVRLRRTSDYPLTPDTALSSRHSALSSSSPSRTSTAVRSAARSVAGAFVACFTPPDTKPVSARTVKNRGISARIGSIQNSYSLTPTRQRGAADVKFTMEQIYKATSKFSPNLKIGQGGFGTVYKGTLDDGSVVAIKRAKKGAYDDRKGIEFQREIETLTQVEHLNLVQMYGFLEEGGERIVVVEYVPNGSLREHLDGKRGDQILDFSVRLDIAIDVAHAITYLHTYTDHPIIHRDIKSSNILLTNNRRAKVKGTAGYLDPEYIKTYQLTDKSDVYSFGALLVELVSGRRAVESKRDFKERLTAKWAIGKFMEGGATSVLDPRLERNNANNWAVEKILQLALQCLAPQRDGRPTMKRCAEILWSIRKEYRELSAISHSRSSGATEE